MSRISLLQLGDIHFPDAIGAKLADRKDSGISAALTASITPQRLPIVFSEITRLIDKHGITAILMCGDLTSYGDIDAYTECVQYLNKTLDLVDRWQPDRVHVVPGNHDVNRRLADRTAEILPKFEPLEAAWSEIGFSDVLATGTRRSTIQNGAGAVDLFSLNSCVGCGEHRYLPDRIRDQVVSLIRSYDVHEVVPPEVFDLVAEQLDTPAFDIDDFNRVTQTIEQLAPESLPVLLAHHNLLPQALLRVEVYTELINSGLVRSRLIDCGKPVIYLHGHIHDDPAEIISKGTAGDSSLICISAPEITEGFNRLDIYFSSSGLPLGCILTPFRFTRHASVKAGKCTRIPLVSPDTFAANGSELAQTVVEAVINPPVKTDPSVETNHLASTPQIMRFNDIRDAVRERTGKQTRDNTVVDAVREAHWFGLIRVDGIEQPQMHWHIARRGV